MSSLEMLDFTAFLHIILVFDPKLTPRFWVEDCFKLL